MPITYEVDRDKRLMITRASGRVTPSDVFAYLDAIFADPANEKCDELFILNGVDSAEISAEDVRAAARHAAERGSDEEFRVAVVAPGDADFGLWRMFQTFRDLGEDRLMVFRSLEEACKWLGVEAP